MQTGEFGGGRIIHAPDERPLTREETANHSEIMRHDRVIDSPSSHCTQRAREYIFIMASNVIQGTAPNQATTNDRAVSSAVMRRAPERYA
jgi:hypothetical protein